MGLMPLLRGRGVVAQSGFVKSCQIFVTLDPTLSPATLLLLTSSSS
jgi:hypothetical protein